MLRGDFFLSIWKNKDLEKTKKAAVVVLARSIQGVRGAVFERDCLLILASFVSEKEAEMRVMRVGRTIDRAVWLAKRGGECQKLDPEIMAGIQPNNLCLFVL